MCLTWDVLGTRTDTIFQRHFDNVAQPPTSPPVIFNENTFDTALRIYVKRSIRDEFFEEINQSQTRLAFVSSSTVLLLRIWVFCHIFLFVARALTRDRSEISNWTERHRFHRDRSTKGSFLARRRIAKRSFAIRKFGDPSWDSTSPTFTLRARKVAGVNFYLSTIELFVWGSLSNTCPEYL